MRMVFRNYFYSLVNDIPNYVFGGLLLIFCLGVMIALLSKREVIVRVLYRLIIIEYSILIYCSTVFFRAANDVRKYDFTPFWSYKSPTYLTENIMNIVIFVPIGFLLGCAFKDIRWWTVFLTGMLLSMIIECLQFAFKRGFTEVDDVMHNTLGCLIGYGVYALVRYGYERVCKGNMAIS